YRIKDAQGQWRWFLDRSTEVRPANGESLIEGLVTDITERKKEEEFRNKLTDQVPGVIYQYRLYRKRSFNPVPCTSRAIVMGARSPCRRVHAAGNTISQGSSAS
ncbi:MAG: PAS domain S-box protein, partial [Chloroflexales bacterium]